MTALPGPFTITPHGLRDRKGGKKTTGIQQGYLGSSKNSSKDSQDPSRIFGELEDTLVCALPCNPARQERQINHSSYFGHGLKRGAAFLEGLERIKGTLWGWEQGSSHPLFTLGSWGQLRKVTWLVWQDNCPAPSSSGVRVCPDTASGKHGKIKKQGWNYSSGRNVETGMG